MKLATLLLALALSGCAVFAPVTEKIAVGVNKYCEQPYDARLLLRAEVNKAVAPNAVKVTCDGDPA